MSHHHQHLDTAKGLKFAFWLNLVFSIIEIIGGFYTNSTAILADAFHDFMDVIAIGLAVLLEQVSNKKSDDKYTFGYKRYSVLSAVIVSAILVTGSIFMIREAILSFSEPNEIHTTGMLLLALVGIAANGLAFLKIKNEGKSLQAAHEHEHGAHDHEHGSKKRHQHANPNSQAVMLHLLEDVLGWVAVLIGAVIIYFTGWIWVDSVLTLGIASYIIFNAIKNLCSTAKILMQGTPVNLNLEKLKTAVINIPEVEEIKSLRVWTLDGAQHVASTILIIKKEVANDQDLLQNIQKVFSKNTVKDVTIQIERAQ